jgi:hypothetical protein
LRFEKTELEGTVLLTGGLGMSVHK